MSILRLFPKALGWIRTFLTYYDSRHSLKRDSGLCVFRFAYNGMYLVMHLELVCIHRLHVCRSSNPRSHHEKCCRKDA